jgi:hypothetical protein
MHHIHKIMAAGTIGKVCLVTADRDQKLTDDPKHRLDALKLGRGALLDRRIYAIPFVRNILVMPASIKASATFQETGPDAQVAMIFRFASGAIVKTLLSHDSAGSIRASVVGNKGRTGSYRVSYSPTTVSVYDNDNAMVETFAASFVGRGMQFHADEAERLIASRLPSGEIMPTGNRSRSRRRWSNCARTWYHFSYESNWPPNVRRGKFALQGGSIKAGSLSTDQAEHVGQRKTLGRLYKMPHPASRCCASGRV